MVVTHVKELLVQNSNELYGQYPDIKQTFYCAGLGKKDMSGSVIFASVQSISSKVFKLPHSIDLLLVDEAHLISPKDTTEYQKLIKNLKILNPKLKVIGFTGTPFRPDSKPLVGDIFTDVAYQIPMLYLIEKGFLSRLVTPNVETKMSTIGVKTRNGDYIESQLQEAVDKDHITKSCVDEIIKYGFERKCWLIFTSGVDHCLHVRDEIRSRGISCEMITGKTPKQERDQTISDYKSGKIRCLVNVAVLTTGFNNPMIDLMAFMRPTRSPVLYVQVCGRGMRTSTGKENCMVLDFGGVIDTLGPVDTIDARQASSRSGDGDAPIKVCPKCESVCFAGSKECHDCGYIFTPPEVEIEPEPAKSSILSDEYKPLTFGVKGVTYKKHTKNNKNSMQVTYHTLNGFFSEWICFEHFGFPREKAINWHRRRLPDERVPINVDEALKLKYPDPVEIQARKNGKYYEVIGYSFQ